MKKNVDGSISMNGKILLDTNIVIALFRNDPPIISKIKSAMEINVPCIVIGELYFGANKSLKTKENLERIGAFSRSNNILNCDENTAQYYGVIKDQLRKKGRPIPENDIWIAAIALQYDLTLISRDEHFKAIEQLKIKRW